MTTADQDSRLAGSTVPDFDTSPLGLAVEQVLRSAERDACRARRAAEAEGHRARLKAARETTQRLERARAQVQTGTGADTEATVQVPVPRGADHDQLSRATVS